MNPANGSDLEKKLREFRDFNRRRPEILRQWKKNTGGKILGILCSYVPRELLWACGILPVRIHRLPDEGFDSTFSSKYLPSFVCPFARSALDSGLRGAYDELDGLVFSYTCDAACGLFNIWSRTIAGDFFCQISQPYADTPDADTFLLAEYQAFCKKLEQNLGVKPDVQRLKHALKLFQDIRKTVERFYALRRKNPFMLSGRDFYTVLYSGFFLPPPEFLRHLEELVGLCSRQQDHPNTQTPFFLCGSILEDLSILDLIENAGGVVIDDDICSGRRYFLSEDHKDPPTLHESQLPSDISSLLTEMVKGLHRRNPCPSRAVPSDRFPRLLSLYENANAKGMIVAAPKFCDPTLADYPLMHDYFKKRGIPLMYFEMEEEPGSGGQWKTRMDAFLEMTG